MSKFIKYIGEDQHGFWSLRYDRKLHYHKNCHDVSPEDFFRYSALIKWWDIGCELDWYRMQKESGQLAEKPPTLVLA